MISPGSVDAPHYDSMNNRKLSNSLILPFVNLFKYVIFDVAFLTIAFLLSMGNVLSKDPYMGRNYQIPYHYIAYFILGFLLTYKCLTRISNHSHVYRHFIIACAIFLLVFTFIFLQMTYNDQNLSLLIRTFLSAGSGIFFVNLYSLHVYYENKACEN
ncbi:unnamed protein product [Adineta ricciae]|uniref:Uncharacterized protein n=1 Tax=Adineta ricciae TaxID=249248 RepID=A0A813PSQ9_ADIRI|nr:unnamed protein product [Adineta ricciae]CAF1004446.1 unnamed protein product [Adineta ricciae]